MLVSLEKKTLKNLCLSLNVKDKVKLVGQCSKYHADLNTIVSYEHNKENFNMLMEGKTFYQVMEEVTDSGYDRDSDYIRYGQNGLECFYKEDFEWEFESYIDEVIKGVLITVVESKNKELSWLEEYAEEYKRKEKKILLVENKNIITDLSSSLRLFDFFDDKVIDFEEAIKNMQEKLEDEKSNLQNTINRFEKRLSFYCFLREESENVFEEFKGGTYDTITFYEELERIRREISYD